MMFRFMIALTVLAAFIAPSLCAGEDDGDWITIEKGVVHPFNLEITPLEIKADATGKVEVSFSGPVSEERGGISIDLTMNEYTIINCGSQKSASTASCADEVNIYRITKINVKGKEGLVVSCNDLEIINDVFVNDCDADTDYADSWVDAIVAHIEFVKDSDNASNFFRPAPVEDEGEDEEGEGEGEGEENGEENGDGDGEDTDDQSHDYSGAGRVAGATWCLATTFLTGAALWGI